MKKTKCRFCISLFAKDFGYAHSVNYIIQTWGFLCYSSVHTKKAEADSCSAFFLILSKDHSILLFSTFSLIYFGTIYIDFVDENFVPKISFDKKKVIRMRTFSKAYGMAGLRVGFAIGEKT